MKATEIRKSYMDIGKLYFWTATINNWNKLLEEDELKEVIISSLKYLVTNKKIEIYCICHHAQSPAFCLAINENEWKRETTYFVFKIYGSCF